MAIVTVHGQDVQTFTDDQQCQIITVVVEGATGQHLRSKCRWAFHSRAFRVRDSRCGRERESKTAGPGQGSTSGDQVRVPKPQAEQLKLEWKHDQVDWGQQGVIRPGSPEAWSQGSGPPGGSGRERIRGSILKFTQDTG